MTKRVKLDTREVLGKVVVRGLDLHGDSGDWVNTHRRRCRRSGLSPQGLGLIYRSSLPPSCSSCPLQLLTRIEGDSGSDQSRFT
ncbi:hypothetical protein J6590_082106 [Homalodisca vitripennis]|nr:hypothetical protein J6590_082106 [Homalodisca vitripennis]